MNLFLALLAYIYQRTEIDKIDLYSRLCLLLCKIDIATP